jgi:hypothetical protein
MDGCSRQNPAYRPAKEKPRPGGAFLCVDSLGLVTLENWTECRGAISMDRSARLAQRLIVRARAVGGSRLPPRPQNTGSSGRRSRSQRSRSSSQAAKAPGWRWGLPPLPSATSSNGDGPSRSTSPAHSDQRRAAQAGQHERDRRELERRSMRCADSSMHWIARMPTANII